MADKIELCTVCERQDLSPVTVHKMWAGAMGNDLWMVVCNGCGDFIPVKLPSFDFGGKNLSNAIEIWNKYQIEKVAVKKAIAEAAGEDTKPDDKEEETDG